MEVNEQNLQILAQYLNQTLDPALRREGMCRKGEICLILLYSVGIHGLLTNMHAYLYIYTLFQTAEQFLQSAEKNADFRCLP